MECPQCASRKARRACPALGTQICAVCCGTKRLVEIACPADCGYLAAARAHPPAQVQRRREADTLFMARHVRALTERQYQLFVALMFAIARHARHAIPPLADEDVAGAAAAGASTLETAGRGIVYEHRPQSLPAQRLLEAITAEVQKLQKLERRLTDADAAAALRAHEQSAGASVELGPGDRQYVELIGRILKEAGAAAEREAPAKAEREAPRIIVP